MTAWLGPAGAPQDFRTGGHIYEIKVCPIGAHTVIISSLEQLNTGNTPTTLHSLLSRRIFLGPIARIHTERSCLTNPNSITNHPSASSDFELKLAELGFDETSARMRGADL